MRTLIEINHDFGGPLDAWITHRPEDHHTAILRAAYADLERTGAFQPRGEG